MYILWGPQIAPSDDVRLFREYLSTTIARSETEKKTYT